MIASQKSPLVAADVAETPLPQGLNILLKIRKIGYVKKISNNTLVMLHFPSFWSHNSILLQHIAP